MQETRTFVRLDLLQNLFASEGNDEAWVENVLGTVGENGYGMATTEEGDVDTAEFACDEMEFASVDVYDFMGSAYEAERFYPKDVVVFMHKATGNYYVLNSDSLFEF
jgi:hypothetical protein